MTWKPFVSVGAATLAAAFVLTGAPAARATVFWPTPVLSPRTLPAGRLPLLRDAVRAAGHRSGYDYSEERDGAQLCQTVRLKGSPQSISLYSTDGDTHVTFAMSETGPERADRMSVEDEGFWTRFFSFVNRDLSRAYSDGPVMWGDDGPYGRIGY